MKRSRNSCGPDETYAELYKCLDLQNRKLILNILQFCWENNCAPDNMNDANIGTLFKKGDPAKPKKYRPIALLNMLHKIYTIIIRERIKPADEFLWSTQFGFRTNRSTQQPLHIIRRVMHYIEESQDKCILTLLDWEKLLIKLISAERLSLHIGLAYR